MRLTYNGTSDLYVRSLGYSSTSSAPVPGYAGTTFALCNLLLVATAAAGARRLLPAARCVTVSGRLGRVVAAAMPTILAATLCALARAPATPSRSGSLPASRPTASRSAQPARRHARRQAPSCRS